MRNVLSTYGEKILNPSPNQGCRELREALASYLARSRDMHVPPEGIIIGSGAEYLYGLNVQVLGRDRVYGLENPSYEKSGRFTRPARWRWKCLPWGRRA